MALRDAVLQRVEDAIRRGAGALSVEQLAYRPEGKWSIAEILDHLGRTFSLTARGAERALAAERPLATRPSLRSRALVILVVELGYFPTGRKAPKVAEPVGIAPADALALTCQHLQAMDDVLARAAERFGTRVRFLDHPILGPLNIRQWRKFHWIHTRHHSRQIAARVR